jgi:hypothetical protein
LNLQNNFQEMANIYNSFGQFAQAQARNLSEIQAQTTFRAAAIITAGEIKNRVESRGQGSNNNQLESKSKNKFGVYSEQWGLTRAAKGRQVNKIDLNFTGTMWRAWLPVPTEKGYGATFTVSSELIKAAKNERLFGPIFRPTNQEIKLGLNEIDKTVKKILKRR